MLTLFLLGLMAVVATIVIIAVAVMGGLWLKDYIKKKLENRRKHKVAFADTREVVDEYLKNKAEQSDEISMEELERMCSKTPYVAAVVDENGNIDEYEGFTAAETNENFSENVKQQKGMLIVGV